MSVDDVLAELKAKSLVVVSLMYGCIAYAGNILWSASVVVLQSMLDIRYEYMILFSTATRVFA